MTSTSVVIPAIDDYLREMMQREGSDLHFLAGDPPRVRVHGELKELRGERIEPKDAEEALYQIMSGTDQQHFSANHSCDFAYFIDGLARFRVNVFRHLNGVGGIFRAIPSTAKTLDQLNMPDVIKNLCRQTQGLILVTGKTGSGKSTTLAAMLDAINTRLKGHILTIEDPIEFVHGRKGCLISQREIGSHSSSFADALHSALREDPDVVLVGELRDYETMSIAVTAAEMGILVMGTLHTNGAAQTVDRIINAFPADKQSQIRTMLSTSLRGVISQQLIPTKGKPGRVAALEILVNTPAISNLLRQGKLDMLENAMQSGGSMGMRTMDMALSDLYERRFITGENAYLNANTKQKFEKMKSER